MSSLNLGHVLGLDKLTNNKQHDEDDTSKHNEDTQTEGMVSLGSPIHRYTYGRYPFSFAFYKPI